MADTFTIIGTMAGDVGSTPGGFYVWGVNRGAGTAGFAANGLPGILFDRVVILRPDGTGTVAGVGPLPAGSVIIDDDTITATFAASFLLSTGFGKGQYTWNLWPRDGIAGTGFAQISDFAPDTTNFVTAVVSEPTSLMLALAAAALCGATARRRAWPHTDARRALHAARARHAG